MQESLEKILNFYGENVNNFTEMFLLYISHLMGYIRRDKSGKQYPLDSNHHYHYHHPLCIKFINFIVMDLFHICWGILYAIRYKYMSKIM